MTQEQKDLFQVTVTNRDLNYSDNVEQKTFTRKSFRTIYQLCIPRTAQ